MRGVGMKDARTASMGLVQQPSACQWRVPVMRRVCVARAEPAPQVPKTLQSLDQILGQSSGTSPVAPSSSGQPETIEWWMLRPKQSAPPRQTGMAPGSHGRFVMSEDFLKLGELRVGRKTQLGGQLELPKVQPVFCFVLLLINVICYATYTNVSMLQGPEAGLEFMSGLWLTPALLSTDWAHLWLSTLTASCLAPGPVELLASLWALAMVAPRAESAMGYGTFLFVYLMSAMSGSMVQVWVMSHSEPSSLGACGAAAAVLGVLGSLAAHYNTNSQVESQAAGWRSTPAQQAAPGTATGSAAPAPTPSTPTRQQSQQRAALIQAVCVTAVCLALAGMQHLEGHPSDSGGGAGLWGEVCWGVGVLPQLAGLGTGFLLGLSMGPRYFVQREVHLEEGAMFIPDQVEDMMVVLDRTTTFQRGLAVACTLAGLSGLWGLASTAV